MSQRKKKRSRYYCTCYRCTGTIKPVLIDLKESIVDTEMQTEIKHYEESNI